MALVRRVYRRCVGRMGTIRQPWADTTFTMVWPSTTHSHDYRGRCIHSSFSAGAGNAQTPEGASQQPQHGSRRRLSEAEWRLINNDAGHPSNNVPSTVTGKIEKHLLHQENHPLNIIKRKIHEFYASPERETQDAAVFTLFDDLSPVVTVKQNFDELLTPEDHVSRKPTDTFYLDDTHLLRCHTSAHQTDLMRSGHSAFLVAGDVYRRDEIDSSHYPVFHQMEGVRVFTPEEISPDLGATEKHRIVVQDLKEHLEGMIRKIFGDVEMQWIDAYFPFTDPSYELEIFWEGEWLEVLGCGMIHPGVLENAGRGNETGWAFGLGLERLAMILFEIPDIRLFWTDDERFHEQFKSGEIVKFQPYSKYPPCYKDITFWLPESGFHENDFFELVRSLAGDLVESVKLIDDFWHPKKKRQSHCYRIIYRSMDRNLTNEEVDEIQMRLREEVEQQIQVELR
eukprot:gb/GECG01012375.1/.p1 GENE.gb/GECG01012375.1/~~gb/GECG01012375.1/.p1  ORF type:complete len:453 (+),score=55.83 gb/GECG01012375.1/:1-1359(+)